MKEQEALHSLIRRAKEGDQAAEELLIERFQPLIQKYVRQATLEDAKDVEQELKMRLLMLIRNYREELPHGFMELVEREWKDRDKQNES
jgi:DNA-directed RNA polymerase specialized sigma24 family protein